ncbi:MAG TPA: hypothetical protein VNY73_05045, partial [Bacteroidia bacterium]|nr:hypothetical protein [Bacteroidia bacterium]
MRLWLIFILALLSGSAMAQMVQTHNGTYIYFDPEVSKKNKLRELTLNEHYKYFGKRKVKISRCYGTTKVVFDTAGKVIYTVYLWDKGSDTLKIPELFEIPKADGKAVISVTGNIANRYYIIKNYNGEERVQLDTEGKEIFSQKITHNVESATHVDKWTYAYDSLSRLVLGTHIFSYMSWVSEKNGWDTIPLHATTDRYVYQNNHIIKRESIYLDKDGKES